MVSDAINCEVMLATPSNFKQTDPTLYTDFLSGI